MSLSQVTLSQMVLSQVTFCLLVYGSPCYGLSKYNISQLENTQKRIVKWIIPRKDSYKEKLEKVPILPLPVYIQINNLLLLSKILGGRYDSQNLQLPIISSFSRLSMFQLDRPKNKTLENDFFHQTCRLSDFLRLNITNQTNLKKKVLTLFWQNFNNFTESDKCTWKMASDCTMNNCRSKTNI